MANSRRGQREDELGRQIGSHEPDIGGGSGGPQQAYGGVPLGVGALIETIGDGVGASVGAAEPLIPRARIRPKRASGHIPSPNGVRSDAAGQLARVYGEPDAFPGQGGRLPGRVADGDEAIGDEGGTGTLAGYHPGMDFDGRGARKGVAQGRVVHERVEVVGGVDRRVRLDDPDPRAHTTVAVGERPGISVRGDVTTDGENTAILGSLDHSGKSVR